MRVLIPLSLALLMACAQPQATPADPAQNGADCAHAVVITAPNETEGIRSEYQWLKEHHPGAVVLGQALASCGDHAVDRLAIRFKDGHEGELYFDISSFFGKN